MNKGPVWNSYCNLTKLLLWQTFVNLVQKSISKQISELSQQFKMGSNLFQFVHGSAGKWLLSNHFSPELNFFFRDLNGFNWIACVIFVSFCMNWKFNFSSKSLSISLMVHRECCMTSGEFLEYNFNEGRWRLLHEKLNM